MDKPNCSICCNDIVGRVKSIKCPNCNNIFCIECQERYQKGSCMNCRMEFKYKFIIESLGKDFYSKVVKPVLINQLFMEQQQILPLMGPLVEWEQECRQIKKNIRFGGRKILPTKPIIQALQMDSFNCPRNNCHGVVPFKDKNSNNISICSLCAAKVCWECQEETNSLDKHQCNPATLQSILDIRLNTKPCPKCRTVIHRSSGCDDMFCTFCSTRFNWVTGKIVANNTNQHYNALNLWVSNRQVSNSNSLNEHNEIINAFENICHVTVVTKDRVSIDYNNHTLPNDLFTSLYKDAAVIRLAKKTRYNDFKIFEENEVKNEEMRIAVVLKELDENQWKQRLYINHRKCTLSLLYSHVMQLYLEFINDLQVRLNQNPNSADVIRVDIFNLVNLVNDSFASICDEYGGNLLHIRNINESDSTPSIYGL